MHRRTALQTTAGLAIGTLAGCAGQLEELAGPSEDEVKSNAEGIAYEELYRNISEYEGEPVYYDNQRIIDVVSGDGTKEYILRFNSDSGWGDSRLFYCTWDGDPYRQDDVVQIWGVVKGLKSYTSMTGEKTVPEIEIVDMEQTSIQR